MRTKIALLFFLFFVSFAFGQYDWKDGEVILKNGDTLRGQIVIIGVSASMINFNNEEKVIYRKERKSKMHKYRSTDMEKVIFLNPESESTVYEYVQIAENRIGLLTIICTGKVTLYARNVNVGTVDPASGPDTGIHSNWRSWSKKDFSYSQFNEYYVLKENEKIAVPMISERLLSSFSSFQKRAMQFFSDCPELVSKLKENIYEEYEIKRIVDEYNECN